MTALSIATLGLAALAWPFVVPKKSASLYACEGCEWWWEVAAG